MKYIDGQLFKEMVISGANNLYNTYPEIDALNVFPVPDGDTGINMNLTMSSGVKEIQDRSDKNIYNIAKAFSKGLLLSSRGNSGAITSQIFRGLADSMIDKEEIDVFGLAEAFENARKVAYKAVITPVEGTILTVIRESSEKLNECVKPSLSIEDAFKVIVEEAHASLERTPNLLPVLKEVGVVDSGGAGLCKILDGMYGALTDSFVERNQATAMDVKKEVQTEFSDEEEFGYCTEFILRLGGDDKKAFNKNRFTNVLNSHGNSIVCVQDDDIIKVHIHTLKPGDIFNYAQQFGEFVKLKCENMSEQHHEILFNAENGVGPHMAASELKSAPLAAPKLEKKETKKKAFGIVATSSGSGIDEFFKEVGADEIVSGGQTMNPSTQDFIDAIHKVNAKTIFVFPNNGNIILSANAARDVLKDEIDVVVIETKTIMQGIVGAMNLNPDLDKDENINVINDAIKEVKSGQITYAIKDSELNGVKIKKDEFMAIKETKDIISTHKKKTDALYALLDSLIDDDSAVCTIIYGADISEKEAEKIRTKFEDKYPFMDLDLRSGNQPVYSFVVGVE